MELSIELKQKQKQIIDFVISLPLEKWNKSKNDNIFSYKCVDIEFIILSEHFLHVKYNFEDELIKSDIRLNEYQKKLVVYFDKIECLRKESYFDNILGIINNEKKII